MSFQTGTQPLVLNCPTTAVQQVSAGIQAVTVNLQLPDGTITGGTQPYSTFYSPNTIIVGQATSVTVFVTDSSTPQQLRQCTFQVTALSK